MYQKQIPVVVFNDTRVDRHHGCARVMGAVEHLSAINGFRILKTSPAHHCWKDDPEILAAVDQAKLLIVNGEGTIHHDREAGRRLLEVAAFARSKGIPSALINAGWEANGKEFQGLVRHFSLVSMRDSTSSEELSLAGVRSRVVPDLSLYLETDSLGNDKTLSRIGYVDCVNRFTALEIDEICRAMKGRSLSILYSEPGLFGYLMFIRQVIAQADLSSPATLSRLVMMRHRIWRASTQDTSQFLQRLSRVKLLVSGRFHACTLALLTETPFVSMASNTQKITSLIKDAGLAEWRGQIGLQQDELLAALERGWSARECEAIADYVASTRTLADQLFRDMRELVS